MLINGRKVSVFDIETDPFLYDRDPEPFAVGFYTGTTYRKWWGENCLSEFIRHVEHLTTPHIIYAHNGGKFDFMFLLYAGVIDNPIKIINGRIVKAKMGIHELRDSYAIMPIPLAVYQKDDIDYKKFEKENREKNKDEICAYLKTDCLYLYELVTKFIDRFDLQLTIGSTAIKILRAMHPFEYTTQTHDEKFRQFYFGGRVQFFESGIIKGKFKVIDVNSMYPYVMHGVEHPFGEFNYTSEYMRDRAKKLINKKGFTKNKKPYFIHFTGTNKGAIPVRTKAGLDFNIPDGEFFASSHEIIVALKYGLVTIDNIHAIHIFKETINFKKYVNTYIKDKIKAKKNKDKAGEIFAKLLLNSSYGKTAQCGDKFKDYYLRYDNEPTPNQELNMCEECNDCCNCCKTWEVDTNMNGCELWSQPSPRPLYYDVAIGASITGAARAVLLEALCKVKRPIYCDTDSVICEDANGLELDPSKLGAWDIEATGDKLAIAGKKMYAMFDNGECVKLASKGARLLGQDIIDLCNDKEVTWQNDAPNFKMSGEKKYVKRRINKRT